MRNHYTLWFVNKTNNLEKNFTGISMYVICVIFKNDNLN